MPEAPEQELARLRYEITDLRHMAELGRMMMNVVEVSCEMRNHDDKLDGLLVAWLKLKEERDKIRELCGKINFESWGEDAKELASKVLAIIDGQVVTVTGISETTKGNLR